jgi:hypothetical protein
MAMETACSAKAQFENWVKDQGKNGWLIELRSTLAIKPNAIDMDLFTGPFIGNQHLRGGLLKNITQFKEKIERKNLRIAEIETKEGANFYFMSKPETDFPEDAWGNRVMMGDTIVLKDGCKYIGCAQVSKKRVGFACNKTFWNQDPLSSLKRDDISGFLDWIDKSQTESGVGPVVSAIRGRNIWIKNELMFTCFYMTTNKSLEEWTAIFHLWLEEVSSREESPCGNPVHP